VILWSSAVEFECIMTPANAKPVENRPPMSEEDDWNWPLASAAFTLVIGGLVALATAQLRIVGGLILVGCWAAICAGATYAWYGTRWFGISRLVASALVLLVVGTVVDLPTTARIFVYFLAAVNLANAWWRSRRLKPSRELDS
jgi:hypothetical protein